MRNLLIIIIILATAVGPTRADDHLLWRLGAEAAMGGVPRTNGFLRGDNPLSTPIGSTGALALRADFAFSPASRLGRLYPGLRQGIGLELRTFNCHDILGRPASLYIYQGAPFARLADDLTLGYEWQFGAAFGWHRSNLTHYLPPVSTRLTAHMALALKFTYRLSPALDLIIGPTVSHYSNGNTAYPNGGVNTVGLAMGIAWHLPASRRASAESTLGAHVGVRNAVVEEAYNKAPGQTVENKKEGQKIERRLWATEIIAYGAWRKRPISIDDEAQMIPGHFGVAGLQVAEIRQLGRWFGAGAALTAQYDESSGLGRHWVEGTVGDNIKFTRPPVREQLSLGLSLHGELTAAIFTVSAGLGVDLIRPRAANRFFQSLALKTFLTPRLFLHTGYRIGDFRNPQNLMLGLGVRL